jgi:hypothetical protein
LGCHPGRRGGKTRAAAALAVYLAALCDHSANLAIGETGVVLFVAENTKQAGVAFGYAEGIFDAVPLLASLVSNRTQDTITLVNAIVLEIRAASFRGLRGPTYVAVVCDEAAFWACDDAVNADAAILTAVRPALATTQGPLIVISSPYARRGEVWATHRLHYGASGDPRILVAQGSSRDFNPSLSELVVARAYERDALSAAAEYGGQFRSDLEAFVTREAIEACVSWSVVERAPLSGIAYHGAVDPSGGSRDAMTLAISHREGSRAVLDCLREVKPPFAPSAVVEAFAEVLKTYRISTVRGDRYAGEWPREQFRHHGIDYVVAGRDRSAIYVNVLPLINSARCDLLDHPKLISQLVGLERRTGRGRDVVDHARGAHDDVANAAALALVAALDVAAAVMCAPLVVTQPFPDPCGIMGNETYNPVNGIPPDGLGSAALLPYERGW